MRQIDLFSGYTPGPALPAPAPEPEPPPFVLPDVLPGQVGLFEPRSLLLGRARAAVAEGRLDDACEALDALRARCPDDAAIAREAAETAALRDRLARIDAPRAHRRAEALLAVANDLARAPEPRASLRRRVLARLAVEIQRQHGDGGELDGRLAGEYLLEAGELEGAQASLAAAAATRRQARPFYRLADAIFLRGDVAAARRVYLQALLLDPFDAALGDACDEAVRGLPAVVRYQIEIDDEAEAWCAPAGVLKGVFPRPSPEDVPPLLPTAEALPPRRREALDRARAFVAALAASGSAPVVEVRRTLKRLSPQLFAAYMEGWVRRSPG